jgi:hypothetical protein
MEEMVLRASNTNLTLRIQFYETSLEEAGPTDSQEDISSELMRKSWLEIVTKISVCSSFLFVMFFWKTFSFVCLLSRWMTSIVLGDSLNACSLVQPFTPGMKPAWNRFSEDISMLIILPPLLYTPLSQHLRVLRWSWPGFTSDKEIDWLQCEKVHFSFLIMRVTLSDLKFSFKAVTYQTWFLAWPALWPCKMEVIYSDIHTL